MTEATPTTAESRAPGLTERLTQSRGVAWSAWGLAMAVLALTVTGGTLHLRVHLREHLAQRDGEILTAVALARQYANGSGSNLTQRLSNPADQLALLLEISQIKEGVLGVRLFDGKGKFETAFPPTLMATNLEFGELSTLRKLQPVSRYYARVPLQNYFFLQDTPGESSRVPLLEITIPLHARGDSRLVAAAQLLLDGREVETEYSRVDSHLLPLALGLYFGGAALLSGVLLWAYRRLKKAHQLVEERTARLLRANHELALAAKTSALGAVTAHLIHGLSNPLANLRDFIAARGNGKPDDEFQALAASTRRMQQLVSEVVRVLGEERAGEQYQLTLSELAKVLAQKLGPMSQETGVALITEVDTEGTLSNRDANLVLLILENLTHNALKVTPRGGHVSVRWARSGGKVTCSVADEGPGLAPGLLTGIFAPCRSTHGGSGLGLAISKQLANHLGAELELQRSSAEGCVFTLTLPQALVGETEVEETGGTGCRRTGL